VVSALPEPPSDIRAEPSADVHDGMEAPAFGGTELRKATRQRCERKPISATSVGSFARYSVERQDRDQARGTAHCIQKEPGRCVGLLTISPSADSSSREFRSLSRSTKISQ
jgi:hypothetical protein